MTENKLVNAEVAYRGDLAESYDRDRVKEPIWDIEHNYVKTILKPFANSGVKILDVPFGTGRFAPIYDDYAISVLGIDISEAMLNQARGTYPSLKDKWELQVGSSTNLSIPDKSVDVVLCFRLFHLLSPLDVQKSVAEFKRVARKEIIIHYFNLHKNRPSAFSRAILAFRRMLSNPETPWKHIKNHEHYRSDALALFKREGLEVVQETFLKDDVNKVTVFELSVK